MKVIRREYPAPFCHIERNPDVFYRDEAEISLGKKPTALQTIYPFNPSNTFLQPFTIHRLGILLSKIQKKLKLVRHKFKAETAGTVST